MKKFDKQRQARVQELAERIQRDHVERNVSYMMGEMIRNHDLFGNDDFMDAMRKDAQDMWDEILDADSRPEWLLIEEDIDEILLDWEGAISNYFSRPTVEAVVAKEIQDRFFSEYGQEESNLTYGEMLDRMIEDGSIDEREACLEVLEIDPIVDEFSPDSHWSEIQDLHDHHCLEPYHEVMEWWVVDEWLQGKLSALGCVTFDFYGLPLWGRCATNQSMILDGVFQEIAEDMLEEEFKREDEQRKKEEQERKRKLKEEVLPAFGSDLEEVLASE